MERSGFSKMRCERHSASDHSMHARFSAEASVANTAASFVLAESREFNDFKYEYEFFILP